MYFILDADMIEEPIVAHLPGPSRGFAITVPLAEVVNAILYKLKSGVHLWLLPVKALFSDKALCWQSVYYHYRKWCLSGDWRDCWIKFLNGHKGHLDLSSVDFDSSRTLAKQGGENVEYQARKRSRTTNALYLTDRASLGHVRTDGGQPQRPVRYRGAVRGGDRDP